MNNLENILKDTIKLETDNDKGYLEYTFRENSEHEYIPRQMDSRKYFMMKKDNKTELYHRIDKTDIYRRLEWILI